MSISSNKVFRTILAWLLTVTLVVGFMPSFALAAPAEDDATQTEQVAPDDAFQPADEGGDEAVDDDPAAIDDEAPAADEDGEEAAVDEQEGSDVATAADEDPEATPEGGETPGDNPEEATPTEPSVTYRGHQQRQGWMDWVADGKAAGLTGQALRLEAFQAKVEGTELEGSIEYRAHVQSYGWMDWVSDGATAGTTGQSKRVEAIQIRLTGELADTYDVWYRTHIQKHGWLGWTKNGEKSGSAGCAFRMESVQIRLVPKGGAAPGSTDNPYRKFTLTYTTHVQKQGWQSWVSAPNTSGTTGKELRVEAMKLDLNNNAWNGSIQYRAHVQQKGWMSWVDEGKVAGTTGQSLRMEAVQIRLTGEMATNYDIYYRAHVQGFGWMGWAKNGESAGSQNYGKRLEAIQIKIVFKGAAAPGSTSGAFKRYIPPPPIPTEYVPYINKANNYSSNTSYIILVDCDEHKCVILKGKKGSWEVEKFWDCGDGKSSTPTVHGVFTVQSRGLSFGSGYTCWYWTQFYGNYLFHSVLYNPGSKTSIQDGRLGVGVSHGCVRLNINNAKWIYDNIPRGTKVVVYG